MTAVATHETAAQHLIGVLDDSDLVIACCNAPQQTVLSGQVEDIERAEEVAGALNLSATRLSLPYASHHPSMSAAVDQFVALADDVRQLPFQQRVFSPIHGRRYTDGDDLVRLLGECLVLPVRFTDTVRHLHERGADTFIETGALRALTRCVALTVPGVRTFAPLEHPDRELDGLRVAVAAGLGQVVPERRVAPPSDEGEPERAVTGTVPERAGAGPATETASQGATGARGGSRSRAQVLDRLRALYAEALEYPPDVLTDAAGLEADLGVDSLKQTALLRRVMEEFALDDPPGSLNLATLGTLADVADHVMSSKPVQEAAA